MKSILMIISVITLAFMLFTGCGTAAHVSVGVGVGYPGPWIGGPYMGGGWYGHPGAPGFYPYRQENMSKIKYVMIVPFADL